MDIGDRFLEQALRFGSVEEWPSSEIVLVPNPRAGAAIDGRVLGPSGEGVPDIKVTLHVSPAVTGCTCVSRTTSTDGAGAFRFGPIVSGTHRIVVVDPEGRFGPRDEFPVLPGEPLELVLED